MKKILAILLFGVLTVGLLGGCGNNVEAEKPQEVKGEINNEEVEQENKPEHKGIEGSSYTDLTTPLEEMGFPKHDVFPMDDDNVVVIPAVSYEDKSGLMLKYYLSYYGTDSDYFGEIEGAVFSIENVIDTEPAKFIELAKNYLGFCASMPYENSDQQKIVDWVKENMEAAGPGKDDKDINITIGDAKFTLSGYDFENGIHGERTLRIEKVQK